MLYAPLVAKFALAFCLCLGLLVSYAARSAEFCERTVLFTTHTQPSAAHRSRTEYRAGLEPLISPRPVCHRSWLTAPLPKRRTRTRHSSRRRALPVGGCPWRLQQPITDR